MQHVGFKLFVVKKKKNPTFIEYVCGIFAAFSSPRAGCKILDNLKKLCSVNYHKNFNGLKLYSS